MDVDAEPVTGRETVGRGRLTRGVLTGAGRLAVCLSGAALVRLGASALGVDLQPSPAVLDVALAQAVAVILGVSLGLLWSLHGYRRALRLGRTGRGRRSGPERVPVGRVGCSAPGDERARST